MTRFALLILICIIIWSFWMTWEWLRNKPEPLETDLERDRKELIKNLKLKEQEDEKSI